MQYRLALPLLRICTGLYPVNFWLAGRLAKIEKGKKVLEVGSGWPLYKVYSGKVGEEGIFVALDIDPFIQKATKRILSLTGRSPREQLVVGDVFHLPFQEGKFDVVLIHNPNFESKKEEKRMGWNPWISEVRRVLEPGGCLLATFSELPFPLVSKKFKKTLRDSGFEKVVLSPLLPGFLPVELIPKLPVTPGVFWTWAVLGIKNKNKLEKC